MILVVDTQYMENYGAHDWDGVGACPQYWKFKGGSSYKVTGVPYGFNTELAVGIVSPAIIKNNDYCRELVLGYRMEADDWMSDFEQSQLEYDGAVVYPEPTIDFNEMKRIYDHEYVEWAADQDAIYYGA